ncbi:MAG: ATP-grasp domain-containing protein [Streptosporangiales bacterium]
MKPPRVLVTGVGGPAGRSVAVQLRERGAYVVGVDMALTELPGVATLRVPPASDPELIEALRSIVARDAIELVVPTVSEELPVLAAARRVGLARVAVASAGTVRFADDKLLTARRLHAHGVPVPRFATAKEMGSLAEAYRQLGWPLVAKPRVSRGGRGVVVIRSSSDVAWEQLDESWILQEFAPGTEYAPMLFRSAGGDTVVIVEKTALAGGETGNATRVRRLSRRARPAIADAAVAAVDALGLTGACDIDVRCRADGTPVVLEVNARFGANSAVAPELLDQLLMTCSSDSDE